MSLLPQRKKSPEEIAKLREGLGIPGLPVEESPALPEIPVVTAAPLIVAPQAAPVPMMPLAEPAPLVALTARHGPKPVHSLKRSERALPPADDPPLAAAVPEEPVLALAVGHKIVRSLRKSEQVPLPVTPPAPPPADSSLPSHRHSDQEIGEIRRREALAMLTPAVNPKLAAAHLALIIPGYLAAVAGAPCYHFYQAGIALPAGCVAAALLIAGFIFLRRPLSQHHAAFIAVISLFVIVFGALHYFPQLRHGT